jgi:hypothetical protein
VARKTEISNASIKRLAAALVTMEKVESITEVRRYVVVIFYMSREHKDT